MEFIFQCPIFLPFHTVHGVFNTRTLKWFAIPSPVEHILSELSTMTRLSRVALHSMAHSFVELVKTVVHAMKQGKLEVVKQEMARVNVAILGISKLKWIGMGEFNSDDYYIYYYGQEPLRRME